MMIARLKTVDSSVPFLREGYAFISARCDRLGVDAFRTRIAGRPVVCIRGKEAAEMFYTPGRFTRKGALPPNTLRLLQDKGSVQTLDGAAHLHRKAMFLDLMSPASIDRLTATFTRVWQERAVSWDHRQVVLHDEVRIILTQAVCEWAGVPVQERGAETLAREFSLMIDQSASFGPPNWWAQARRGRTEKWVAGLVERIRAGELEVRGDSAAAVIALHREPDGGRLPAEVAAVELINVLRPTVAVGRFIVFAAVALVEHPEWRSTFAAGDTADLEAFAQEVRRFYPFFPAVGGVAREDVRWQGNDFPAGTWMMLDLYGTNHDSRIWRHPYAFDPTRFRAWDNDSHTLVPQGGGDVRSTHRCPGERISLELVKAAVLLLAAADHQVAAQDLSISLGKMPALPSSGFILLPQGAQRAVL
jgi:fatty-acid peroxygenase